MARFNENSPTIKFYTNHGCPWAHRAHIVLKELDLPYEEVIIDLNKPREPWYLEINPRGLVPAIDFNGEIITESATVSQFLADAYPSHLLPATGTVEGALFRARVYFFVDTWFSKANGLWFKMLMEENDGQQAKLSKEFVDVVGKEIEPLLSDAKPFFGGSEKMTMAEVCKLPTELATIAREDRHPNLNVVSLANIWKALTASFILRTYGLAKHGFIPKSTASGLDALPNFSKWAAEVLKQESVLYIWDEESMMTSYKAKIDKLRAQAKGSQP